MKAVNWALALAMGMMSMGAGADDAQSGVKFACDNDRIAVAVNADRTTIEISRQEPMVFGNSEMIWAGRTTLAGSNEHYTMKLFVRGDRWGRVTIVGIDGRQLADELVYCPSES